MARRSFLSRKYGFQRDPLVLVVESGLRDDSLSSQLELEKFRIARAHSVSEAVQMIDDLHFLGVKLDGIVADFNLKGGLAYRVIERFREAYQDVPAAVIVDRTDISVNLWARSKRVLVLNGPPALSDLNPWLEQLKVPA